MKDYVKSDTTRKIYYPSECIRLVNMRQLLFYMKHGVEILDFYPSKDFKTNEDVLVFVVNKKKSQKVYQMWQEFKYD